MDEKTTGQGPLGQNGPTAQRPDGPTAQRGEIPTDQMPGPITPPRIPATPTEAEELAKAAVGAYLTSCRMADRNDIGNYLLKLVSVAGVLMAKAEGSEKASERFVGTAYFLRKTMPKRPATLRPIQ